MKLVKLPQNDPLKSKCDSLLKQSQETSYCKISEAYAPRQMAFNDSIRCRENIKAIHHSVARIQYVISKAVPKTSGEERFLETLETIADDLEKNTLSAQCHCERSLDILQEFM